MKSIIKNLLATIGLLALIWCLLAVLVIVTTTDDHTNEADLAFYQMQRDQYNDFVKIADGYFEGKNIKRDYQQAFKYYHAAVEVEGPGGGQGAQLKLAYMYQHGLGVPQNYARAVRYYRYPLIRGDIGTKPILDMAHHGSVEAQNLLGDYYKQKRESVEALKWYQKAAEKNNRHALVMMGKIYSYGGGGVGVNEAKAADYFAVAAQLGDEYAQDWLETKAVAQF